MRHVIADGFRFFCLEEGPANGPLALLLHGFPDTPHGWRALMSPLAARGFHVVAPFMRGYAPTEIPGQTVTLNRLAADVVALIDALGHEKASVLIGHDWGAATAYLAATLSPDRIDRMVAIGLPHPSSLKPTLGLMWAGRHFLTLRWPGAAARMRRRNFALVDTLYRRWSPTWKFGPEETAPVKEAFAQPGSLEAAIGYYRSPRSAGAPGGAKGKKISVPTVVVAGLDDPAIQVSVYESAKSKFSGPYAVEALRGGHFVHRESPDGFRDVVLSFLERAHDARSSAA